MANTPSTTNDHESDSDTGGNHTAASNGNAYGDADVIRPLDAGNW